MALFTDLRKLQFGFPNPETVERYDNWEGLCLAW